MVDLSKAKRKPGSFFPDSTIDGTGAYERVEPILTAKLFQERFLWGLPISSPMDGSKPSPSMMKDYIKRGVAMVEMDTKTSIMPAFNRERLPFDPFLYQKNMWFEVPKKPIQKVNRVAICSASYAGTLNDNDRYPSGAEIYTIPNDWVDMSYASHGKVFVNPLNPAFASIGSSTAAVASGATIMQFINTGGWIPAFWTIEYLHGLCTEEGNVPVFVNECIGQAAGILFLDNLIPLYRIASQSLGVDGLSQSVNDLGYQLLTQKRDKLAESYEKNCRKVKTMTSNSFFVSNI